MTLITHDFWQSLSPPDVHPHSSTGRTWGVAYRIKKEKVEEVRDNLDLREKNGYTVHTVPFHVADPSSIASDAGIVDSAVDGTATTAATTTVGKEKIIPCAVYIGTPDNEAFVGPKQTPVELAAHILASKGPSGENREYLYKLRDALVELSPDAHDHHIEDLARIARELEKAQAEAQRKD